MHPKTIFSAFLILVLAVSTSAQDSDYQPKRESLFEGTIGNDKLELYIQSFMQECTGNNYYDAVFRINGQAWDKLEVFAHEDNSFLFVVSAFANGRYDSMMQVKQSGSKMTGKAYERDGKSKVINIKKNKSITDFKKYRKAIDGYRDIDDC